MNKIDYAIGAVIAVVLIVSFYIYLSSQNTGALQMSVGFQGVNLSAVYPFQRLSFPIAVDNTGNSPAKNLSLGIYVNRNLTLYYKITLPPKKALTLYYNYTPTVSGLYNIVAVLDPGNLYNIADRNAAQSNVTFSVENPEAPESYILLKRQNATGIAYLGSLTGTEGFTLTEFLNKDYGINLLGLGSFTGLDGLFAPIFSTLQLGIKNLSISYAKYGNGGVAHSIWIRGYAAPTLIPFLLRSEGYQVQNYSMGGTEASMVTINSTATLCSWYSGGWTKVLVYEGSSTCMSFEGSAADNFTGRSFLPNKSGLVANVPQNSSIAGNYSYSYGNTTGFGTIAMKDNQIMFIGAQTSGFNKTLTCYGILSSANGTQFCSSYVFPVNSTVSKSIDLVKTEKSTDLYNATVYAFVNGSRLLSSVPFWIGAVDNISLKGTANGFVSALSNTCSFGNGFACADSSFANSTLSFAITNENSNATLLNSVRCYNTVKSINATHIGTLLAPGNSVTISPVCYNGGNTLQGIPLDLNLVVELNYSIGNSTHFSYGQFRIGSPN